MKKSVIASIIIVSLLWTNTIVFVNAATQQHQLIVTEAHVYADVYVDDSNNGPIYDGTYEHPYKKIQDGINNSESGDIVYVFSGTYKENLVVDKGIKLNGENKENTIIDGNFIGDTIWVKASHVTICRFKIINSSDDFWSAGIQVIEKQWFYPGEPPVVLEDIKISNCILINNNDGIRLHFADTIEISNCVIRNNYAHSIYIIPSSKEVNIKKCEIYDNGNYDCSGGIIMTGYYDYPIYCENINISYCNIYNNGCIGIDISGGLSNINVHNNQIYGHTLYGIFVSGTNQLPLSNITIYNNEIKSNGGNESPLKAGIYLQDCIDAVTIKNNNILSNYRYSILIRNSSYNNILENNIINNRKNAYFEYDPRQTNTWNKNYWNEPRYIPKLIFGLINKGKIYIPWVEFDWNPAKEPYNIVV